MKWTIILMIVSSFAEVVPKAQMIGHCLYKYRYSNRLKFCKEFVSEDRFDKKAVDFCLQLDMNRNFYPCLKVIAGKSYEDELKECREEFSTPMQLKCLAEKGEPLPADAEKIKKQVNALIDSGNFRAAREILSKKI